MRIGKVVSPTDVFLPAGGVMDLKNSDITGANSIYLNDEANVTGEGIQFMKEGADPGSLDPDDYESLRGYRGRLYYGDNVIANVATSSTTCFDINSSYLASIDATATVFGRMLYVTGLFTTNAAITDTTATLFNIDLSDLGISSVDFVHAITMFSDGGNAYMMAICQQDGDVECRDTIPVDIASGDVCYFTFIAKIDSFL